MGQAPRIYSMLDSNLYSKQLSLHCSIELHKNVCSFEYSKVINSELLFKVSGSHQEGQYDSWVLLHHRQQLHGFCVCLLIRPLICTAFFLLLCVCLYAQMKPSHLFINSDLPELKGIQENTPQCVSKTCSVGVKLISESCWSETSKLSSVKSLNY